MLCFVEFSRWQHWESAISDYILLLACLIGQYCFAGPFAVLFYLSSSVVVCNAAGGRAGRPPGTWGVGRPTLHGAASTVTSS